MLQRRRWLHEESLSLCLPNANLAFSPEAGRGLGQQHLEGAPACPLICFSLSFEVDTPISLGSLPRR